MKSPRYSHSRSGLALLEVILAIAILAGAMVMLSQLMRLGGGNAILARETTKGNLLCEGIVAQISAGYLPAEATQGQPVPEDPGWVYSVEIGTTEFQDVIALVVTVEQNIDAAKGPARIRLVRWMPDPASELALAEEEAALGLTEETEGAGEEQGL